MKHKQLKYYRVSVALVRLMWFKFADPRISMHFFDIGFAHFSCPDLYVDL